MESKERMFEHFRSLVSSRFEFLQARGFRRMPSLEETRSTFGTVVYLGKHVGFVLSLDVRDQCVDAEVVSVHDGKMIRNWEGGYSENVFTHLVKHAGLRRGFASSGERRENEEEQTSIERMIDDWADLLEGAGQALLQDGSKSLLG